MNLEDEFSIEEILQMLGSDVSVSFHKPGGPVARHRICPSCHAVFPNEGFAPRHPDLQWWWCGGNTERDCPYPDCNYKGRSSTFDFVHVPKRRIG